MGMDIQKLLASVSDRDRQALHQRATLPKDLRADPKLDLLLHDLPMPYPPGQSPNRCKGTAYLGFFGFANAVLPEGAQRVKDAFVTDPGLRSFLETRFDRGAWYDMFPFFYCQRQLSKTLGVPLEVLLMIVGREQCRNDLSGSLRFVLKVVSNKTIATTLTLMGSSWWETIKYKTQMVGERRLEIRATGIPFPLRHTLLITGAEYNAEALRLSGAKDARFEVGAYECEGPITAKTVGSGTYYLTW